MSVGFPALAWPVVPLVPLILAVLLAWRRARPLALALAPGAALPAALLALAPPPALEAPWLLLGARFGVEAVARPFLVLTALLWLFAGVFAGSALRSDPRRARYFCFHLLALAGNVSLVIAGDLATFYAGFALMSYSAYGLVAYAGTEESRRAGRVYVTFVAFGEVLLLAGLLHIAADMDGLALMDVAGALARSPRASLASGLVFLGLGVKAGVLGFHVWLPLAHPVAPTPASALLSGAMIKAGVLGWLVLLPLGARALAFGPIALVLGFAAALYAAAVGVTQQDSKTVLAYSSVSQMGLVTMLVGAGLSEIDVGASSSAAAAAFALHHGLAKGALFLSVGLLRRRMSARAGRWALFATLLPIASLAGLPLLSGAAAKAGLKDTLEGLARADFGILASFVGVTSLATLLLLGRFFQRLVLEANRETTPPGRGQVVSWLCAVLASLLAPLLLIALGSAPLVEKSLQPRAALEALWPFLVGLPLLAFFAGFVRRPVPQLPAGDLVVGLEAAARVAARGGRAVAAAASEAARGLACAARRGSEFAVRIGSGVLAAEDQLGFTTGVAFLISLALLLSAALLLP
jgi:formate hydrogenlyase subunit 3/multisubunit Na+/H+ antiporter MnhD subunit